MVLLPPSTQEVQAHHSDCILCLLQDIFFWTILLSSVLLESANIASKVKQPLEPIGSPMRYYPLCCTMSFIDVASSISLSVFISSFLILDEIFFWSINRSFDTEIWPRASKDYVHWTRSLGIQEGPTSSVSPTFLLLARLGYPSGTPTRRRFPEIWIDTALDDVLHVGAWTRFAAAIYK